MPCIPYEMTGEKKSGFFSGFNAVDKVVDDVRLPYPLPPLPSHILTYHSTAPKILHQNKRHISHLFLLLGSRVMHHIRHGRSHQPQRHHANRHAAKTRKGECVHA